MYADGNMTNQSVIPITELSPAQNSKIFLTISFAPCASTVPPILSPFNKINDYKSKEITP